ncbi:MAG: hypothetical protein KC435_06315 [Thermomicrobiales bacterium]|nr:hypothetical protein [Thermomicrobiales bacterium]
MRRHLASILITFALIAPLSTNAYAQSGDATWLNNLDGLQTAIGRSWTAPINWSTTESVVDINDEGTPIGEAISSSTPMPSASDDIVTMSALIYEFDTPEHAANGLKLLNADQMQQVERDPRAPAINEFSPENLGDLAYGHEGSYDVSMADGSTLELAVVYLMVQDGNLVYQIFGQFQSGDHVAISTDAVAQMIAADTSDAEAIYDMNGASTGGLWEKLNAITIELPEGSSIYDLEIYPVADDAVMGSSVIVPAIGLSDLAAVPGLSSSWYAAYEGHVLTELAGTPGAADGVFSIELWILEFDNPTDATAAAFSMNDALNEPLGILTTEDSGFGDGETTGLTFVNSGFVRDNALPAGDAATVVALDGNMLYAARVYASGPAPTPIAKDLVASMQTTEAGAEDTNEPNLASGGMWEKFPESGSDAVFGLELTTQEIITPEATPAGTPRG